MGKINLKDAWNILLDQNLNPIVRAWNIFSGNEQAQERQNAQNDWNYQVWQENNAYNSPEQMMRRYKDAGINEAAAAAAITGQGQYQGSPATSGSGAQTFSPLSLFETLNNSVNSVFDNIKKITGARKEIHDANNQDKTTVQDIKESEARIFNLGKQNYWGDAKIKLAQDTFKLSKTKTFAEIEMMQAQTNNFRAQALQFMANIKKIEKETRNLDTANRLMEADIENRNADTDVKRNEINVQNSEIAKNYEQVKVFTTQASLNNCTAALERMQYAKTFEEKKKIAKEALEQDYRNALAEIGWYPSQSWIGNMISSFVTIGDKGMTSAQHGIEKGINGAIDVVNSVCNELKASFKRATDGKKRSDYDFKLPGAK